jgi:hypothetical protein
MAARGETYSPLMLASLSSLKADASLLPSVDKAIQSA